MKIIFYQQLNLKKNIMDGLNQSFQIYLFKMDNTQVLKWNNRKSNSQKHSFIFPSPSLRQLIIESSNCRKNMLNTFEIFIE